VAHYRRALELTKDPVVERSLEQEIQRAR
jgi:hypothetical protein